MSLSKAITFLKQVVNDSDARKQCIHFDTKSELLSSFGFSELDFDDAINMQLVKCQSYEQAETYQQLRLWFTML